MRFSCADHLRDANYHNRRWRRLPRCQSSVRTRSPTCMINAHVLWRHHHAVSPVLEHIRLSRQSVYGAGLMMDFIMVETEIFFNLIVYSPAPPLTTRYSDFRKNFKVIRYPLVKLGNYIFFSPRIAPTPTLTVISRRAVRSSCR